MLTGQRSPGARRGIVLAALFALFQTSLFAAPTLRTVTIGTRTFVTLRDLAAANHLRLSYPTTENFVLSNATHTLRLKANSRETLFNGTKIWINSPVIVARGAWSLESADAAQVLDPLLRPQLYLRSYRAQVVLLDPGHGGKDVGAVSPGGLLEKDITLDIARRLRVALVNAGYRVHLTRDNDRFVDLSDRAAMIARFKADLFVSIHVNSSAGNARGVETYALPAAGFRSVHAGGGPATGSTAAANGHRHAAANAILAHAIQRNVRQQTTLPDRGVRFANYVVLRNATAPAALVECGFVTNAADEAMLRTAAHRDRIAAAIALGIQNYARTVASAQPRPAGAAPAAPATPSAPRPAPSPSPVQAPPPPAPPANPPTPTMERASSEIPQFSL